MDSKTFSEQFKVLLARQLVPEFCSDPKKGLQPSGFVWPKDDVSEEDCRYLIMALRANLILHVGQGKYRTPLNSASEQFFWEGPKGVQDRKFWLWLEPVITVGGLARLHFDFGWPKALIGTQSTAYAFDLFTRLSPEGPMHIACEVKKSTAEVRRLINLMREFGAAPDADEPPSGPKRNAWKKVDALRREPAPVLWVLGPNGLSVVFKVEQTGRLVNFVLADEGRLLWCNDLNHDGQ